MENSTTEFTIDNKVTLRHLLSHQSGMQMTNFSVDKNVGMPTLVDVVSGSPPAINKPAIPEFIPGTKWQYSNIAYVLVQLLLEDITGKSFQDIAEEIIFNPLGMNNSQFVYPLDNEKSTREAMPHDYDGNSREPSMHNVAFAPGGLTTTSLDLAKFVREIVLSYQGKSDKILLQNITKQLLNKESDYIEKTILDIPFSIALGAFYMGEGKDLLFLHTGGNFPGFKCWIVGWPEQGNGIVVMTNSANGRELGLEIISAFTHVYNSNINNYN